VQSTSHVMQGDVLCAEALNQILVTRDGQSRLLAAFIHRVVPLHQTVSTLRTPRSNKLSWLATWRDRNIFLHRTHVGMAVQVWCTGHSCMLCLFVILCLFRFLMKDRTCVKWASWPPTTTKSLASTLSSKLTCANHHRLARAGERRSGECRSSARNASVVHRSL